MNRGSALVKLLRKFMQLNPLGVALMRPFHSMLPKRNVGHIYIVGAPRSGTTITYQKLIKTYDVKYLDNFMHLTFGIPFIRGLSNRFKPSQAESSQHGFVGGLRGAAEGLHFWKYWTGYDTTYRKHSEPLKSGLTKYIDYLEGKKRPFLSCYIPMMGHIAELQQQNPNAFFILLRRDMDDVKRSLTKCYTDMNLSDGWFSVRAEGDTATSAEERIDKQVALYEALLDKDAEVKEGMMTLTYDEIREFSETTKTRILESYNTFAAQTGVSKLKLR